MVCLACCSSSGFVSGHILRWCALLGVYGVEVCMAWLLRLDCFRHDLGGCVVLPLIVCLALGGLALQLLLALVVSCLCQSLVIMSRSWLIAGSGCSLVDSSLVMLWFSFVGFCMALPLTVLMESMQCITCPVQLASSSLEVSMWCFVAFVAISPGTMAPSSTSRCGCACS